MDKFYVHVLKCNRLPTKNTNHTRIINTKGQFFFYLEINKTLYKHSTSGNMQRMWATIMLALIVVLSISIQTKGKEKENDLAHAPSPALAPESESGLLPNPISCIGDVKTIPNCVNAVKTLKLINVSKNCCVVLLNLPEDCFGYFFPISWLFRFFLKLACKIFGHI